ncbi:hypothetical protein EPN87_01630 [archaeon]|nr:MAG: hypothetical protein EPN87_01630 [archaeon]
MEEEQGKVYATSRIAFIGNYLIVGLLVALLILIYTQFNLSFSFFPQTLNQLISSLIVLGFLMAMSVLIEEPVWKRMLHHYIVTDREIIYKSGLIKKQRVSMPFQSIADVKVEKGVLGRIFNFGDIVIGGFKEGMEIHGLRNPEALYEEIRSKIRQSSSTIYKRNTENKEK